MNKRGEQVINYPAHSRRVSAAVVHTQMWHRTCNEQEYYMESWDARIVALGCGDKKQTYMEVYRCR